VRQPKAFSQEACAQTHTDHSFIEKGSAGLESPVWARTKAIRLDREVQ